VGFDLPGPSATQPFEVRAQLNMWEFAGSFRYNVFTGRVMPFAKAGYGLSWYRLEQISTDGVLIADPDAAWIRRPSLFHNLLPNAWHFGFGVEYVPIRRSGPLPRGFDLGLKADYTLFLSSLGLTFTDRARFGLEQVPGVSRSSLNLAAALSF
jgi:hypothetical protein